MITFKEFFQEAAMTHDDTKKTANATSVKAHEIKSVGDHRRAEHDIANDNVCPRCKSLDIKTYSDGEKECHTCKKTW